VVSLPDIKSLLSEFALQALVTAAGFILGFLAKSFIDFIRKRRPFYRIWRLDQDVTTYMVTGSIDLKALTGTQIFLAPTMAAGDIDAFVEIISSLRLLYPKARIERFFSEEFPERNMDENIVTIGGPKWNTVTRHLLRSSDSPLTFDGYFLVDEITGQRHETEEDETQIYVDYGLILRMRNPYDRKNNFVLLAGCDTFGVLAAAKCMSSLSSFGYATIKTIDRQLGRFFRKPHFGAIVRCDIIGAKVTNIELIALYEIGYDKDNKPQFHSKSVAHIQLPSASE